MVSLISFVPRALWYTFADWCISHFQKIHSWSSFKTEIQVPKHPWWYAIGMYIKKRHSFEMETHKFFAASTYGLVHGSSFWICKITYSMVENDRIFFWNRLLSFKIISDIVQGFKKQNDYGNILLFQAISSSSSCCSTRWSL